MCNNYHVIYELKGSSQRLLRGIGVITIFKIRLYFKWQDFYCKRSESLFLFALKQLIAVARKNKIKKGH